MQIFNEEHIKILRDQFDGIEKIDPSSTSYKQIIIMLDRLSQTAIKQLAGANIKFISALARNRVKLSD